MNLLLILLITWGSTTDLEKGIEALEAFQLEEAIKYLKAAKGEGPYRYTDYVKLHEELGIAYTYLGEKALALDTFDMLLTLDPGFAISYTLSPKVTFVFEEARKQASNMVPPTIHLSWASKQKVNQPISVTLEVASDPKKYLISAKLHTKLADEKDYQSQSIKLPLEGGQTQVALPPQAPEAQENRILQLYLTAYDQQGNQVYLLGNPQTPREISLGYDVVIPWYRKWWVWAVVGGVIAAGTGVTVYLVTREPGNTVEGRFN